MVYTQKGMAGFSFAWFLCGCNSIGLAGRVDGSDGERSPLRGRAGQKPLPQLREGLQNETYFYFHINSNYLSNWLCDELVYGYTKG